MHAFQKNSVVNTLKFRRCCCFGSCLKKNYLYYSLKQVNYFRAMLNLFNLIILKFHVN